MNSECFLNLVNFPSLIFSYAKFLSKHGNVKEALQRMKEAQQIFVKVRGKYEPEYVDIVNDLAVLSLQVRFGVFICVLFCSINCARELIRNDLFLINHIGKGL